VPVAEGVPEPAGAEALIEFAAAVHGTDGLGGTGFAPSRVTVSRESAVNQLLRLSRTRGAEVDLVALGPLTNLATALEVDPDVLGRFRSVTVMGGMGPDWLAGTVPDRYPAFIQVGDPNTRHNPEAAAAVAASGAPITWVGMDVTGALLLPESLLERAAEAGGNPAGFTRATHRWYSDFVTARSGASERVFTAHDSIAVMVALDPDAVAWQGEATAYLGRSGEGRPAIWGRHPAPGDPVHRFVTEVDRARLERHVANALAP
jgi:purine nucleosidase